MTNARMTNGTVPTPGAERSEAPDVLGSNPKSEARNPKQIQNPKKKARNGDQTSAFCALDFGPLNLFRISDFVLRILLPQTSGPSLRSGPGVGIKRVFRQS